MSSSKQVIGHLDKRKVVTRCKPCAQRRIKCQGGFPCEYCTRVKKKCEQQLPTKSQNTFKFVTFSVARHASPVAVPTTINNDRSVIFMGYFIELIQNCQLTTQFHSIAAMLPPMINRNGHLENVAIAIGALEASRRPAVGQRRDTPVPHMVALIHYHKTLMSLRERLEDHDASQRDDVLWTTFLLGLFELLSEPTGERWTRHMLHGTGKLLQLNDLGRQCTPLKQILFGAFEILEANRAIMYGETTFLTGRHWKGIQKRWPNRSSDTTLIIEDAVSLMIDVASLSYRFFQRISSVPEQERLTHADIEALGNEGIVAQDMMHQWFWQNSALLTSSEQPEILLSRIYYHALLLFLCRNYTYYPYWVNSPMPLLSFENATSHAQSVIDDIDVLLQTPQVPGVLVLFPLRVVGSLTTNLNTRLRLVRHLDIIYHKGYVVADRVKADLRELWVFQGLHDV